MRRENGFIGFLLGNPLLLLSAALGIALVVAGSTAWMYKRLAESRAQEAIEARAELGAFVAQVHLRGEEAERETAAKEARQKETTNAIRKSYESRIAGLNAHLKQLRERPPTDPGGREITITTVRSEKPDGVSEKLLPLAEYESLRDRAAADALQVTQLQDWITAQGFPIE